ncbi:MAG: hypothetical protein EBZ77_05235, partial [Chitinophagia bacterium]|nr:hypothetical protein [Chitinophagia bacterium]
TTVTSSGMYYCISQTGCSINIDSIMVNLPIPDTTTSSQRITICALSAPAVLTATSGYLGYVWQDGRTGRTYNASTPGIYYVNRHDTCTHAYVDTFVVSFTAPDTTLTPRVDTSLCSSRAPITLSGGTGFTTYRWSNGATTPNISVSATNGYNVYKTRGCSVIKDTFHVNFIPLPVPNLGPNRQLCVGDSLFLTSAQPAGTTYLWSTGSTNDSILVRTSGTYSLTLNNGCIVTDSVSVLFSPYPTVQLGADTISCLGEPMLLQSTVSDPTVSYQWSTGAATDTTTVNVSGYYWLRVTKLGCSAIDSISVTIYYDTFTLYNPDTAICLGKQVQAIVTAAPGASFQWLPTAGITYPNTANPLIRPDTSATYRVLISFANCPSFSDSFHIDVQPNPTIYAGGNRVICQFDTFKLHAEPNPAWYQHYAYQWAPNSYLDYDTLQDPIYTAGGTQKYIVTATTPAGCVGKDSVVISVNPGNFILGGAQLAMCPGDSVQFSLTGGVSYHWYPSYYLSDSTIGNPIVHAETNQTYIVVGTDANGCTDTTSVRVIVYPNGIFYTVRDTFTIFPGESVELSLQTNCSHVNC